jgi:hypothetical protein
VSKGTVKKGASKASGTVKRGATSHKSKGAPGSALSQRKVQRLGASQTTAKKASATLRGARSSSKPKSAAGSALSQVRNPRSGRYVKIDKTTGRIISYKKSKGAYKGVPIAKKSSKRK